MRVEDLDVTVLGSSIFFDLELYTKSFTKQE